MRALGGEPGNEAMTCYQLCVCTTTAADGCDGCPRKVDNGWPLNSHETTIPIAQCMQNAGSWAILLSKAVYMADTCVSHGIPSRMFSTTTNRYSLAGVFQVFWVKGDECYIRREAVRGRSFSQGLQRCLHQSLVSSRRTVRREGDVRTVHVEPQRLEDDGRHEQAGPKPSRIVQHLAEPHTVRIFRWTPEMCF